MQIFPDFTKRSDQAMNALGGAASTYPDGGHPTASQPFADVMNSLAATDAANRGWDTNVSGSLRSMTDHYAERNQASTGSSNAGQGMESGADDLLVTQEDFADLRDELARYGLNKEDIATLEEQVASPEGVTWRDLMNKVSSLATKGAGDSQSLDAESRRLLTSFLDRLGFSQGEVKDIVADLDEDKLDAAWQKIAAKIASLSPEKTIAVTHDEIKALAKAFNVPGTTNENLAAFFAGGGKLQLNPAGLQNLLLMLKQASIAQGVAAQQNAEESATSMREKLQQAIRKAMERAERDELASNHETKTASQSKVLIKKAAEEHHGEAANRVSRPDGAKAEDSDSKHLFKEPLHKESGKGKKQDGDGGVAGESDSKKQTAGDKSAAGEKSPAQNHASAAGANHEAKNVAQDARNDAKAGAKNAAPADGDELATARKNAEAATSRFAKERNESGDAAQGNAQPASTGNNDARSSGGESQTRSDDSWSAFWNKVAKGEAAPDRSHEFASVVDRGQVEARAAATAERATQAFHRDGSLQRETMRNLEQAFMKNLGQGHRQLTLRLDPPQLGRVAILLTVKNNEVSATLRTERHETGQMLAEQLQQLRHSLEQQGLRVQKLDVQTQMNNDANQQSWLGMDNHNAARDQDARQQTLKAWKQMRGASRSESTLAHDVHNGNVQEQISQGGLHLIA